MGNFPDVFDSTGYFSNSSSSSVTSSQLSLNPKPLTQASTCAPEIWWEDIEAASTLMIL